MGRTISAEYSSAFLELREVWWEEAVGGGREEEREVERLRRKRKRKAGPGVSFVTSREVGE